jgi:hypothetical protein
MSHWASLLVCSYSHCSEIQQLLRWLLLRPRKQTANMASHLLLQHGIHHLQFDSSGCFAHSGLQLVAHMAAA